jgi:hypothetical protein
MANCNKCGKRLKSYEGSNSCGYCYSMFITSKIIIFEHRNKLPEIINKDFETTMVARLYRMWVLSKCYGDYKKYNNVEDLNNYTKFKEIIKAKFWIDYFKDNYI